MTAVSSCALKLQKGIRKREYDIMRSGRCRFVFVPIIESDNDVFNDVSHKRL